MCTLYIILVQYVLPYGTLRNTKRKLDTQNHTTTSTHINIKLQDIQTEINLHTYQMLNGNHLHTSFIQETITTTNQKELRTNIY